MACMARSTCLHDTLGNSFKFLGVRDTAAAILLNDDGHGEKSFGFEFCVADDAR